MPVFAINQPITTKVPTVSVDNSFTPGSTHTFQLVVVNSAGIQSDPVQVTVRVAPVLLTSPVMVTPPAGHAPKKPAPVSKVEPAKTAVQPGVGKATPTKPPAKASVRGKPPGKAPRTPLKAEPVTPVPVGPVKRKPVKPARQVEVAKTAAPEVPPKSSLTGKRRRPKAKTPVTAEETQPVQAKPVKGAPAEAEPTKPGPAEGERAGKKSTRAAAKKSMRKKSS